MRKDGKVVRWNAEKGFGFIRAGGPGAELFFHIRDFRSAPGSEPALGLRVSFEEIHVGGKGPRAMDVRPGVAEAPATRPARMRRERAHRPREGATVLHPVFWLLVAPYAGLLVATVRRGALPGWVLPASLLLNLATYFLYRRDKDAARQRRWRVAERTLHAWSLAGGWVGAWCAQQRLRHKSRKTAFRAAYWATVLLHCAALAAWWWQAAPAVR